MQLQRKQAPLRNSTLDFAQAEAQELDLPSEVRQDSVPRSCLKFHLAQHVLFKYKLRPARSTAQSGALCQANYTALAADPRCCS